MATVKIARKPAYVPADGDLAVAAFADGKQALFAAKQLPAGLADLKPPAEAGAAVTAFAGRLARARVLVRAVRLDAAHSTPAAELRQAVAEALNLAKQEKLKRVVVPLAKKELLEAAREGALLGGYVFDKYLKKKAQLPGVLLVAPAEDVKAARRTGRLAESVNFARDLLNEPPNLRGPVETAKRLAAFGRSCGLKTTVWDEKRLARERCGGILGVGMGSANPPRLVWGEYRPARAKLHLALVGKGVTFDTGGYCLKPATGQIGMKYDMGGAAMMFAAAGAAARLKLPVRLTVLTPLVENRISGDSYLTTSVLKMRGGQTVEVHNTDAEGRLILADALGLAGELKPDFMIDAATLTGACVVGLGEDIAGLFANDSALAGRIKAAGAEVGEAFWELPLHQPYAELLKCTIADLKNIGSQWGGAVTAALFLSQFVPEKLKWAHLDIAGPGCKEEPLGCLGKGAKGFGVRTMLRLIEELAG